MQICVTFYSCKKNKQCNQYYNTKNDIANKMSNIGLEAC